MVCLASLIGGSTSSPVDSDLAIFQKKHFFLIRQVDPVHETLWIITRATHFK